jgi:DTW domain-containing protein YfiP
LRESPGPGQVSTIEAIARALRILEGEQAAAPLEALFAVAVERAAATGRSVPGHADGGSAPG